MSSSPTSSHALKYQSPTFIESKHTSLTSDTSTRPTFAPPPSPVPSSRLSAVHGFEPQCPEYAGIEKDFNDLARYLGTSVLLSTFITTIDVAFLTFAHNVIQNRTSKEFQITMLLCFLTAICHLSIVLVAGRACILAYRYSRLPTVDRPTIAEYQEQFDSFNRCLRVSEWVQGLGQALFGPATLFTIWQLFEDHFYAFFLYGFIAILDVAVYAAGFWRISWVGTMLKSLQGYFIRPLNGGTGRSVA